MSAQFEIYWIDIEKSFVSFYNIPLNFENKNKFIDK